MFRRLASKYGFNCSMSQTMKEIELGVSELLELPPLYNERVAQLYGYL